MTKTLIFSCYYNRTDFLALQDATFQAFYKGDYHFVVGNDAPIDKKNLFSDTLARDDIEAECMRLGIEHCFIPQPVGAMAYSSKASRAYDWMLHNYDFSGYDYVYLCDSDCFLTKQLDPEVYMKDTDIRGVRFVMGSVIYYTEHALIIRTSVINPKEISLAPIVIDGHHTDSGGALCPYLRAHPEVRCGTAFHTCCNHVEGKRVDLDLKDPLPDGYHELLYDKGNTDEECTEFLTGCDLSPAMRAFCRESKELANQECSSNSIMGRWDWRGNFFNDTMFYHQSEGGNWDNKAIKYHVQRASILRRFILGLIEERI